MRKQLLRPSRQTPIGRLRARASSACEQPISASSTNSRYHAQTFRQCGESRQPLCGMHPRASKRGVRKRRFFCRLFFRRKEKSEEGRMGFRYVPTNLSKRRKELLFPAPRYVPSNSKSKINPYPCAKLPLWKTSFSFSVFHSLPFLPPRLHLHASTDFSVFCGKPASATAFLPPLRHFSQGFSPFSTKEAVENPSAAGTAFFSLGG